MQKKIIIAIGACATPIIEIYLPRKTPKRLETPTKN